MTTKHIDDGRVIDDQGFIVCDLTHPDLIPAKELQKEKTNRTIYTFDDILSNCAMNYKHVCKYKGNDYSIKVCIENVNSGKTLASRVFANSLEFDSFMLNMSCTNDVYHNDDVLFFDRCCEALN